MVKIIFWGIELEIKRVIKYIRCYIYMSQAQKRDYKRDKEVQSSHSIWGSSLAGAQTNTGSSAVHVQWFFPLEDQSRQS